MEDRPPYFENRLAQLEMAGVAGLECPSPCTPLRLRETERRFRSEIQAFRVATYDACDLRNDCRLCDALVALQEPLSQAMESEEVVREDAARRMAYGKRYEAVRLRFALAVEALAAATDTPVRLDILRRVLTDPETPWYLDQTEIELVRAEAHQLAAEALARGR